MPVNLLSVPLRGVKQTFVRILNRKKIGGANSQICGEKLLPLSDLLGTLLAQRKLRISEVPWNVSDPCRPRRETKEAGNGETFRS